MTEQEIRGNTITTHFQVNFITRLRLLWLRIRYGKPEYRFPVKGFITVDDNAITLFDTTGDKPKICKVWVRDE